MGQIGEALKNALDQSKVDWEIIPVKVRFTAQRLNTLSKTALVEFGNVGLFKLILICQSN